MKQAIWIGILLWLIIINYYHRSKLNPPDSYYSTALGDSIGDVPSPKLDSSVFIKKDTTKYKHPPEVETIPNN